MAYIGIPPKINFSSGLLDRFTSITGTTVTLTNDISSENDIIVFVNFVKQDSTTYSVGGTGNKTLTLGGTLVSSDIVEVHYLNEVGQTVAPSAGSVGSSQLTSGAVTGAKLNADVISSQTELATAPASTDELLVSDAGVLKRVDVSLVGGDNTPAFKARRGSNQSISHDTSTIIVFDTEEYDTDSAYDTSNGRFTVPSGEGGKYLFAVNLRFNSSTSNRNAVDLLINGGSSNTTAFEWTGGQYSSIGGTVTYNLSAGDYVTAVYYQSSGGAIEARSESFFTGFKLIGV